MDTDEITEIRKLIREGVNVNYQYSNGQRPIHVAVNNGKNSSMKSNIRTIHIEIYMLCFHWILFRLYEHR